MSLTRSLSVFVLALTLSLTLALLHPLGDADLFAAPRSQPPQLPASIPSQARNILANSCADCHSSTARSPLYGHFAPISWLLERDIVAARSQLNLSNWDTYSPDRQQVLLAEIAQQARTGHMPPPQYLLIHRHARLTTIEIATLLAWTHAASRAIDAAANNSSSGSPPMARSDMSGKESGAPSKLRLGGRGMMMMPSSRGEPQSGAVEGPPHLSSMASDTSSAPSPTRAAAHPEGIAAQGRDLFNRRCTGCHSLTQNGEGPRLGGVYGRVAATSPGFSYSAALTAAHLVWNDQTLDQWLTDPDAFIPNNNMDFRVPRPQERADLIAFLKASSGK